MSLKDPYANEYMERNRATLKPNRSFGSWRNTTNYDGSVVFSRDPVTAAKHHIYGLDGK